MSRRQERCSRSISCPSNSTPSRSSPSVINSTIAPCPSTRRAQIRLNSFNVSPILVPPDQSRTAAGVQIFIGGESEMLPLDECSLVTAPYSADGQVVGTLGVVGPTRMAYERVVPIVDITAKLLSSALSHH